MSGFAVCNLGRVCEQRSLRARLRLLFSTTTACCHCMFYDAVQELRQAPLLQDGKLPISPMDGTCDITALAAMPTCVLCDIHLIVPVPSQTCLMIGGRVTRTPPGCLSMFAQCRLFCRGSILADHTHAAAAALRSICLSRGIELHEQSNVTAVEAGRLMTDDGGWHAFDECLWCTQAAAANWIKQTGLPTGVWRSELCSSTPCCCTVRRSWVPVD
eukprot:GHUV01055390.1.p1 GENE.GHUV01055390.1~~GHUV01055390.1.p1  ORF type:complete len:215 (+),score=34.56 GHUV01055390.1:91-735(+)